MMDIQQLTIRFSNKLRFEDTPLFRGGILRMIERETGSPNILFHNHMDDDFRWSYPLIQYKQIDGKAAIVCFGDGVDAVKSFFCTSSRSWNLRGEEILLKIEDITMNAVTLDTIQELLPYRIIHWTPLNSVNYEKYQQLESLSDRACFLERILSANILSMAKGLGKRFDTIIRCPILELSSPQLVERKSVKMMAFSASFRANVILPQFIGLGKHVSIGHGTIINPII